MTGSSPSRAHGPVGAIVLAAGPGREAQRPVDGGTALAVVLRTLRALPLDPVVVVVNRDDAQRITGGIDLGEARIVTTPSSELPMIASIRAGLAELPDTVSGTLVWPVDRPLVSMRTVRALLEAHGRGGQIVVPVCSLPGEEPGRRGHPVIFDRRLFDALRSASDTEGAAAVVRARPDEVSGVEVADRGVLADIASPATAELLARMKARARQLDPGEGRRRPGRRPRRRRGR